MHSLRNVIAATALAVCLVVPAAASAEDASAAPAPAAAPAKVWLHIEGPEDARVQEDSTGDDDWATVCTAPCDKALPVGARYRIVGESLRRSAPFTLTGQDGAHLQLEVNGASKSTYATGCVLLGGGALLADVGLSVLYLGLLSQGISVSGNSVTEGDDQILTAGLVMMGAGAVSAAVGLGLFLSARKSTISTLGAAPPSAPAPRAPAPSAPTPPTPPTAPRQYEMRRDPLPADATLGRAAAPVVIPIVRVAF